MRNTLNILKNALLVSAFFLPALIAFGQGDLLELLPGSERLEYDDRTGTHRLIGNVNFIYQGNKMYCDSAYYFERRNAVRAYGRVHVNKRDTLNLFCDSLYYNGNTRMAKLWGNVRVRDNEYKLTTDTLEYDAKRSQAFYHHGGRVQSILTQEVLTSKVGYFHPESKNFFFSHDVDYQGKNIQMTTDTLRYLYSQKKTFFYGPTNIFMDSTQLYCESGWYNTETEEGTLSKNAWIQNESDYISGDTLFYLPKQGMSIGKGNVFYTDTTQDLSFNANYAVRSDSMNYTFMTGDAIASKQMEEDTLYIHADTLYMYKDDSTEFFNAFHEAAIFSNDFQGRADSIAFDRKGDKLEMYDTPIVWSNGAELKGDFMEVFLKDTVIQRVEIYDHATVLMEVAVDSFYNQVAGKKITAFFRENKLYRVFTNGNAMTVFFPEEEEETDTTFIRRRKGMNRLYASDLRIDIDSNEITGITYLEAPEGVFYPLDQINKEEQFVPGFDWQYALRPASPEDLLKEEEVVEVDEESDELEIIEE